MGDITNGIVIDARDFGYRADYVGDEQTATDNGAALQAACNAAYAANGGYSYDNVGFGAEVLLPKGWGMIASAQIIIPTGVVVKGVTQYGSAIHIPSFYPAANGWIFDIGDHRTQLAAFSCGMRDLTIRAMPQNAGPGAAIIWTNNAQDTKGIVSNLRVNAGNRTALTAEIGYGGATDVNFDNCVLGNDGGVNGGVVNPVMRIGAYGNTRVALSHIQWYGPNTANYPGHYGLQVSGGIVHVSHTHPENLQFGIAVNNSAGLTTIEHMQGSSNTLGCIVIGDPTPNGMVEVHNIWRNGCQWSLADGRQGRGKVTADIKGWNFDSNLT